MVASNFDQSLKRVLVYEGGYSNHPSDPGGATMRGVIQRVYDGYRKRKGQPTRSVKYLTDAEMKDIYRSQYWDQIRGDDLPSGVDFVAFDGAVNSGASQSAKWLQRALGIKADGNVGEATLAAASDANAVKTIHGICDRRMAFLKSLRTWPVFGKGWGRRVADVRSAGVAFSKVTVPEPKPVPLPKPRPELPDGNAKAERPPVEDKPTKTGGFRAIIGAVITALGGVLNAIFGNPYVAVAFFALIAFLCLYLGREWIKKMIEERL